MSEGRAANRAAPEFSGGGSASADSGPAGADFSSGSSSGGPVGTAAPAPADMAVTATSSITLPGVRDAFPDPRMALKLRSQAPGR